MLDIHPSETRSSNFTVRRTSVFSDFIPSFHLAMLTGPQLTTEDFVPSVYFNSSTWNTLCYLLALLLRKKITCHKREIELQF